MKDKSTTSEAEVMALLQETAEAEESSWQRVEHWAIRVAGGLLAAKLVLAAIHRVEPQPHGKFGILVLAAVMILAILLAHMRFLASVVKQGLVRRRYDCTVIISSAKSTEKLLARLDALDRQVRLSVLDSLARERDYIHSKMAFLVGSLEKTGIVSAFLMLFVTASRFGGEGNSATASLDAFDYGLIAVLALYYLGVAATAVIGRLNSYEVVLKSSLDKNSASSP